MIWLIFLEAIPFLAWIWARQGAAAFAYIGRSWRRGLVGGAASLGAYGIVLWAMTRAPVAAVAALRETSVLFAALIGAAAAEGGSRPPAARGRGKRGRRGGGAEAVTAGVSATRASR